MQKSSIIFGLIMFVTAFILTYFKISKVNGTDIDLILNLLITSTILAVPSAIAFFYGVKKSTIIPTIKQIVMAVAFAFLLGNTTAMFFGLREISWFLFALVVIILSYLAPIQFLKPKEAVGE
ncbi:hypothetical protein CXF85_12080 [Colwellia sp. 75C3]|uniref:hypothetical protein n=1 Tax=Colwellia sp. 75C3 TaxID=888425 RepID=UPI000CC6FC8C|nr:hypothetical protein [Colwellia sp. 75C3]PKG82866.1 hypothetical protein CXF85_12080 [Colwellia sp. 75C3]